MEHLYLRCKQIDIYIYIYIYTYIYIYVDRISMGIYIHSNTLDIFPLHVLKRSHMSSKPTNFKGSKFPRLHRFLVSELGDVKKSRQHCAQKL